MDFTKIDRTWCLFLDRDGVLNRRIVGDYVRSWEQFEWLEGSLQALTDLRPRFKYMFIVTNQQGIGKGLMSESQLQVIHNNLKRDVAEAGGLIDAIFYSPDLADSGSETRKPAIGMALRAKQMFGDVDLERSIMVGDSPSDMKFGADSNMKNVLISEDQNVEKDLNIPVEAVFPDLLTFSQQFGNE